MKRFCIFFIASIIAANCYSQAAGHGRTSDSLFNKARKALTSGQFANAITTYEQCFVIAAKEKDSLLMGNALIGTGIAYEQTGRYNEALEYYFKALRVYEKSGRQLKVGGTLKNIGNTYRVLKAYDKANEYLHQALQVQLKEKDSAKVAMVLNDIGLVYMDQDSTAKARGFFEQVVNGYSEHMSAETKAYAYNNLALTYSKEHLYDQALGFYESGLQLMQTARNRYGTALVLGNIGDLYYKTGNYTRALDYQLRSHDSVLLIKSNALLLCSYDYMAKTYFSMGNFKKAYDCVVEQMRLKDTVFKDESRKSYAEMEAKYQNEKKQTQILLLEQNNKIANLQLTAQRRMTWLFIAVSGLILVVTVVLYMSYIVRKRANKKLNSLNGQLQEANSSKAKLISIISHDLRSPVSSLFHFLQLQKIKAKTNTPYDQEQFNSKISQSAENLLEAMEDILVWSKTQMEHFKPAIEPVNTEELLDEVIYLHEQMAAGKDINLEKELVDDIDFDTDPNFLKIILRNLTSNAIKFTPPHGKIEFSARQHNNHILITVADNGPGIDTADLNTLFDWNNMRSDSSGLGLKLAREFTEKLGGTLSVVSEPGSGAAFVVSLPMTSVQQAHLLN